MAADIQAVLYTDDGGNQYVIGMAAAVFAQLGAGAVRKVGGADYTGAPAKPPMPRNLRPRTVSVDNGTKKRRVICLTTTSQLFVGTDTTIDLTDGAGASTSYTRYRSSGERYRFARSAAG